MAKQPPPEPPGRGVPAESATAPARGRPEEPVAPAVQRPLAAGSELGDYVIEARRGVGGFATVYRARDRRTGGAVALKVLHAYLVRTPSILRRFQREAETIARLAHPGIVRLLGYGERDGTPYLAMEWIDGATLAELVRDRGPMPAEDALPILEALAGALAAAHAVGVVHRDLKPANVALADRAVKLLDFGVAKLLDVEVGTGFTTAGTKIGTPHYMAPEQILGRAIDHRADIYAFGILAFEVLTGRRPFDGGSLAEIEEQQLREPPPAASEHAGVRAEVDAVIRRAMEKEPARRYASIDELMQALRAAAGASAPGAAEEATATASAAGRALAVGVYVHAAAVGEEASDDALDLLDRTLEEARRRAAAAGLAVAAETASSLLLVGAPADAGLVRRAEALAAELAAAASHPELIAAITLHVAEVERAGEGGAGGDAGHSGGPLLDVGAWARTDVSGVFVTEAARGLR
ncbi:MAG TPA: serine/threonine-protein kinase [Kofleriaceae bacterium]|nr:serine/threonine-protein kinase [Kofleriaceae bacterium]